MGQSYTVKVCRDCGEQREAAAFGADKRNRDGLKSYCKPCEARQAQEARRLRPHLHRGRRRRWNARHPERARAHWMINELTRSGRLIRPTTCDRCSDPTGRIEAHHEDYSKPLDIIWLCHSCHVAHHTERD